MPPSPTPSLHQVLVLSPARDTEDRPLLESKSPLMTAAELDAARVPCPYAESKSRHGHAKPMNQVALEQVRRHFAGFLGLFSALRRRHQELVGREHLGPEDWHRLCLYGEVLPRLLLLRAHQAAGAGASPNRYYEHRVPVEVGIVFKTVRGLLRLTRTLLDDSPRAIGALPQARRTALGFDQVPRHRPKRSAKQGAGKPIFDAAASRAAARTAPWTADDLLIVTERLELMVGDEEVCAAPQGMLITTFNLLIEGSGAREVDALDPAVEHVLGDLASLGAFADALEPVYRELDRFRGWNAEHSTRAQAELGRARNDPGRAAALFDTFLDSYLLEERRFLDRMGELQASVLIACDIAPPHPALGLAMVDDLVPDTIRRGAERARGTRVEYTADAIEVTTPTGQRRALPWSGR